MLAIANALGASLQRRRRESATLRALGFARGSIATSALLEVLAIGVLASGATLAGLFPALHGHEFGTSTGSHTIYAQLQVGPSVIAAVFGYALVMGLAAAAWPVRRLAFGNLIDGLRAD